MPITIIVRVAQIFCSASEATTVNHKLDFSKAFSLEYFEPLSREEQSLQSPLFKCGSKGK